MTLRTLRGSLLRVGAALAAGVQCCCNRFCRTRPDECGNPVQECSNDPGDSQEPCTESCVPPTTPCECGPFVPCPQCYECVDRKCERIEECCADGGPCPPCHKCEDGVCVPCGPCEECVDGYCLPCGPCTVCVEGFCYPCGPEENCVGGECLPRVESHYCCWDECPNDENGNPKDPPPTTTCKPASYDAFGQPQSPCGFATVPSPGGGTGTVQCSLTKSGPYSTNTGSATTSCISNCRRYDCKQDGCGTLSCQPDPDGPYDTLAECRDSCPEDPCALPCSFAGGNAPGVYSIDGCEREICVNYSSPAGRPIRVQIWGPIMVDGCPQPGSRVIKRDSGWRGFECCDCPDDRNGGDLDGEPHGTLTWSKPAGATQFEVVVLNPCPVFGISVQLDIKCDDACDDLEIARCMCVDGNDCGPECACCGGVCAKPCECDGIADGIDTFCQPKGNVWSAPCPGGGALFYPPCECENDTQAVYYGEPSGLFSEPSTPLKPGKNLLGCHKRILYASTSYGRYQEPGDCPTGNPNYSCCVKVKFKKKLYVCDGDRLRDVTEDYYVSKADCVGDPIDDCQVNSGPPFGAVIVNLGNCPEGTYCVKMNPRECMPCAECDAVEPDTGFFDTAPTCLPPP